MLCPTRFVVETTENRSGGRSVQLPDWVINEIKRQHIIVVVLTLTHRYNAVRDHRTGSNNSGVKITS